VKRSICDGTNRRRNQEVIMSLLYHTSETADLNHRDYSFILVIICMALALVLASVVFSPAAVGAGMTNMTVPGL
jgi:hypothetical protein